jgi:hypothetical protein
MILQRQLDDTFDSRRCAAVAHRSRQSAVENPALTPAHRLAASITNRRPFRSRHALPAGRCHGSRTSLSAQTSHVRRHVRAQGTVVDRLAACAINPVRRETKNLTAMSYDLHTTSLVRLRYAP